nr:MAG TPA: hypothetical protein [Caudoviricetes sp.]
MKEINEKLTLRLQNRGNFVSLTPWAYKISS